MKITAIRLRRCTAELPAPMRSRGCPGYREFFHTGSERQRLDVVEVLADDGQVGVTLIPGSPPEMPAFLEEIALPALRGQDPAAMPVLVARLCSAAADRQVPRSAVHRLEFALWDLAAKGAGQPLWRYLGGAEARPVTVYAGGGSLCWNPLPELAREAEELVARGFLAMKIKIGHGPEEDAAIVRAIRAAVGPDVLLMVDANCAYELEGALRLCPALAEASVVWFEEPFGYQHPEEWQQLRRAMPPGQPCRLAGGEGFSRLLQAARALGEGMLTILQCDAGGFGLQALRATATMAAEEGAWLTPHSCNSAIGFVVAAHLQLAIPNAEIQEFETFDSPFIHSIFNEPFAVQDGVLHLPPGPGIGYTLNEATIERYLAPRVEGSAQL